MLTMSDSQGKVKSRCIVVLLQRILEPETAALFLMVLHGLHLLRCNRSNSFVNLTLWIYLHHASESDGSHIVLLRAMNWWGSTLQTLFFFFNEYQHCLYKWSEPGDFSLICPSFPSLNGKIEYFSGCNNIDLICVNPTAMCSCCISVPDMTLVSHSEKKDFQAKFLQFSQVQFDYCFWGVIVSKLWNRLWIFVWSSWDSS